MPVSPTLVYIIVLFYLHIAVMWQKSASSCSFPALRSPHHPKLFLTNMLDLLSGVFLVHIRDFIVRITAEIMMMMITIVNVSEQHIIGIRFDMQKDKLKPE
jgi:hypothetical protein